MLCTRMYGHIFKGLIILHVPFPEGSDNIAGFLSESIALLVGFPHVGALEIGMHTFPTKLQTI